MEEENEFNDESSGIDDYSEKILGNSEKNSLQDFENNISTNSNTICNNYIFAFFILLIESIISLVKFYLFYKFEFTKLPDIYLNILILILIVTSLSIFLLANSKFYEKRKTAGNCIFFILMSIYKILFGICIYTSITFYSDKILGYPEFEARMFWKITMCCFYIILFIFYYLNRKKNSDNILMYIISTSICLLLISFLTTFTQKSSDDWERIGLYITLVCSEIMFFISSIYYGILGRVNKTFINSLYIKIDWKINEIDYYRYAFIVYNFYYFGFKIIYKLCKNENRCCRKIIQNYY